MPFIKNLATSQMTTRFLLVLFILGVLAFADFLTTSRQVKINEINAYVIATTSRQRSLVVHAAEQAEMLARARTEEKRNNLRQELLLTTQQLETTHNDLMNGQVGLTERVMPSQEVRFLYYNPPTLLHSRMMTFLNQLRLLANMAEPGPPSKNTAFQYVQTAQSRGDLMRALDLVVSQYQKESETRMESLKTLNFFNFIIMILVLILMGIFVFRPMVRSVEKYTHELEAFNEKLQEELTYRSKIEDSLKQSENKLKTIVDTVFDGIITIDEKGTIQFFNPAAERMFRYTATEIVGKNVQIILPDIFRKSFEEEQDPQIAALANYLSSEGESTYPATFEVMGLRKDSSTVSINASFSRYKSDNKLMFTGVLRDNSEQKRVENNLKALTDKLRQSNKDLEDFAIVASHDLQEPLRKILTFSERLRKVCEAQLTDKGMDYLNRMENASSRMQQLINDLLLYSRVTTKAKPFTPVHLEEVIKQITQDLEIQIEELNATIDIGELPELDADKMQMRQLFQNMISNALKFHRENVSPVIRIYHQPVNPRYTDNSMNNDHRSYCQIVVEDNGIGFDPQYKNQIFKVFQRLHSRSEYKGTGIGLSICRKIVERHHGYLAAESQPNKGSRFIITLPLRQKSTKPQINQHSIQPLPGALVEEVAL